MGGEVMISIVFPRRKCIDFAVANAVAHEEHTQLLLRGKSFERTPKRGLCASFENAGVELVIAARA